MFRKLSCQIGLLLALSSGAAPAPLDAQSTAQQQEANREAWQKVGEILDAMGIEPGAVVADVGAGDGFLTARLAGAVGKTGRVFAVDVTDRALDRLRGRVQADGLTNVTVVKGDTNDPHLATGTLDAAVIINAYHEMVDHQAMLRQLRAALKPDGRLVIVEPISEKLLKTPRERQTNDHEIAARFVEQDAREAGFRIQMLRDPLTTRRDVVEWLIVAVPESKTATDVASVSPAADESALASDELRMAFDVFKKRRADGSIVVVDVRSEEEFLAGHVPGATWIELADLKSHADDLRALRKPIVTYCS